MFNLDSIYSIYDQFLSNFPEDVRWIVSLGLAVLIAYGIFKVIKRQFIFLILLVVLLPASVPILRNIWDSLVELLQFLISRR